MIGLFFEVLPKDGRTDEYLERAARLRTELAKNAGLRFIDRYRSRQRPGVILSHQLWADEASLIAWRENPAHRATQLAGREQIFADYRIRVATLGYQWQRGGAEPDGAIVLARGIVAVSHDAPLTLSMPGEGFASVYREHQFITVADERTGWGPEPVSLESDPAVTAVRSFHVIRDYTMRERTEAPQAHPPVA